MSTFTPTTKDYPVQNADSAQKNPIVEVRGCVLGATYGLWLSLLRPDKNSSLDPFLHLPSNVQTCRDLFHPFSICLINRLQALEGKIFQQWGKMKAISNPSLTWLNGRKKPLPSGSELKKLKRSWDCLKSSGSNKCLCKPMGSLKMVKTFPFLMSLLEWKELLFSLV